jgi:adenine-specific DNA-methyltransferase
VAPRLEWPEKSFALSQADAPNTPAQLFDETNAAALPTEILSCNHNIFVGDNIHALRALIDSDLRYHFIYIDPPYNSGQQLTYLDKHGPASNADSAENAWLSMMAPRMLLAQRLLREDGVMFVSIDDREAASLVLLLREIFGRENHIGTLKWKKKRKPSFLDKHLGAVVEYVLVFTKNAQKFPRLLGEPSSDITRPVLNASNSSCDRVLPAGTTANCRNGHYSAGIRKNKTLDTEYLSDFDVENGKLVHNTPVRGRFRVSQELLEKTVFITPKLGLRRHVLPDELARKHASDNCTDWPTNEDGEKELRSLFGERVFDYPKPVGLLTNLLNMCQFPASGAVLCLDFFAGSASLAEAVCQLSEPSAEKFFTLVQNTEVNPPGSKFKSISDLTIARARVSLLQHNNARALKIYTVR